MSRRSFTEQGFMHAPVGLCISRNRVIRQYNAQFCKLFLCGGEELIGASLELLYPSHDDFVRTGDKWRGLLAETGEYADERLMRRRDGTLFWCHVAGKAFDAASPFARATWYFQTTHAAAKPRPELSPRERQVAALLVQGMSNKEVAGSLQLSPRTVEMHRARMMRRLEVSNLAELVQKLLM